MEKKNDFIKEDYKIELYDPLEVAKEKGRA